MCLLTSQKFNILFMQHDQGRGSSKFPHRWSTNPGKAHQGEADPGRGVHGFGPNRPWCRQQHRGRPVILGETATALNLFWRFVTLTG